MTTIQQDFDEAVRGIQQGYDDVKAGRSRPTDKSLSDLRWKHGILIGGSSVQSDLID